MEKEKTKTIYVKPENVCIVRNFLDIHFGYFGHSGGSEVSEKMYHGGISFKSIKNYHSENSPAKYQIIIKYPRDFTRKNKEFLLPGLPESEAKIWDEKILNKLIKIATN